MPRRGRSTIVTRDPPSKLDDHARRFPNGALVQEREVMAIDALVRSGRRDDAEARARRFDVAYPRSGHRRRIDAVLSRD